MKKIRIQFKRGNSLRFLSQLDQHRVFYRALRRAKIPLAYSNGFSPHPQISFATAMSVGMTSEGEYVDIGIDIDSESTLSANSIKKRLDKALPKGLTITGAEFIPEGTKSLSKSIEYADYEITCHGLNVNDFEEFEKLLESYSNQDTVRILKYNKKAKDHLQFVDVRANFDSITARKHKRDIIFTIRVFPVAGSLINPEMIIRNFLETISYYERSINLEMLRKELHLENKKRG